MVQNNRNRNLRRRPANARSGCTGGAFWLWDGSFRTETTTPRRAVCVPGAGATGQKAPILKRAREICVFCYFCLPENPKKQNDMLPLLTQNRRCTAPDAARQRAESQSGPLDRKGSEPRLQGIFHEHGGRRSVDRPQDPDGAGHLRRGPLADPPHGQAARQRVRTPQDRRPRCVRSCAIRSRWS